MQTILAYLCEDKSRLVNMSHCSDPVTCPGGNCIGCKDSEIWCLDPRCSPFCPEDACAIPDDHDQNANVVIAIILLSLVSILFIFWFMYGPQLFEHHDDHARANVIVPQEYMVKK